MKFKEIYNKIEKKIIKLFEIILENIRVFINKDNFLYLKLVLVFVISCFLSILLEKTTFRISHPEYISKVRMIIVAMIFAFIGIHFVFKLSKMYEWIHKNRYLLACAFLLFVMLFKLSGSSITEFNGLIQNQNDDRKFHTILGVTRKIRTDEWATSTTYLLSQGESKTPFSYFSNELRATNTDMFTVSNSPVFDILLLGRPFQIGFILFGNNMGFSFYWYIRFVAMMLASYELCLILTNKNKKISLLGMIMITFSSAVQWWYCMDTLIWGQVAVVLFDKFMNTNKNYKKYIIAFGVLVSGLSYIFVFYPAWQLPFGYVFLGLTIWIIIKNLKYGNYKINIHDILVILITLIIMICLLGRWYSLSKETIALEMNTDYPGERQEIGGGALNIYSYFYDIFFAREEFLNPCEFSSMLSFFPVPLILGFIYVFRNKRNLHFWAPMLAITSFLAIWCVRGFPVWLANLTKMSISTAGRTSIPLGTACIYMLIYLIGNYDSVRDKLINKKASVVLSLLFTIFIAYKAYSTIGYKEEFHYLDKFKMLFAGELFLATIFCILNFQNKMIGKIGFSLIVIIAFMSGLTINPVISTTNIFYEKPFSKKVQEIKEKNPDAIWAFNDDGWYCNDYLVANGVPVINSTQVYPNFDLYKDLLGEEKAEEKREIYNRYCHINFVITDEKSDVELIYADNIVLYVNYNDLHKINVKYIATFDDLSQESYSQSFDKIYEEDGIYIFEVN